MDEARLLLICVVFVLAACAPTREGRLDSVEPQLTAQRSGTDALLIGLHVVSERIAWAAGTGGTVVRTVDGGETWEASVVPGADTLQFRDVHAFGADVAYLLSIGPGAASRIYKTVDGGQTWETQFVNDEPDAFFDCFDFWDENSGIAFSDEVGGRLPVVRTEDGQTWTFLASHQWPAAAEGEGGFAASGTCLQTLGPRSAVIGTGNAAQARVLRSTDRGETWTAAITPLQSRNAAGITSLAFRDERIGVALGGDLTAPDAESDNVAVTNDGGRTWHLAGRPTFPGAAYGSSYVPRANLLVAVGPRGASYSSDDGSTWAPLDTLAYWSVDFAAPAFGWAVGPDGRITKIRF